MSEFQRMLLLALLIGIGIGALTVVDPIGHLAIYEAQR